MSVLLGVARDLTASLATADRYRRLLDAVRRVIPCDAACLRRVDGPYLTPVAGFGLSSAALSRRYDRREQPRRDAAAKRRLVESDWPGNVRELENVVARAVLRAGAARAASAGTPDVVIITASHLDVASPAPAPAAALAPVESIPQDDARPFREQVAEFERRLIATAIEQHGGNWAAAARSLGMHRSNLHHLATRLGLRE